MTPFTNNRNRRLQKLQAGLVKRPGGNYNLFLWQLSCFKNNLSRAERGLAPTKCDVFRVAACDKRKSSIAKPEFRNCLRQHRTIRLRRLLEKLCPDFVTFSCHTQSMPAKKCHHQNPIFLRIRSCRIMRYCLNNRKQHGHLTRSNTLMKRRFFHFLPRVLVARRGL